MDINKKLIERIIRDTTCEWTRGFLTCVLDVNTSSPEVIARGIIESNPNAKIQAIKDIRNQFGLGLKEAKFLVDEYQSSGRIVFPKGKEPPDCNPVGV